MMHIARKITTSMLQITIIINTNTLTYMFNLKNTVTLTKHKNTPFFIEQRTFNLFKTLCGNRSPAINKFGSLHLLFAALYLLMFDTNF